MKMPTTLRKYSPFILFFLLLLQISTNGLSQPGTPDATFNVADTGDQTGFGPWGGDIWTSLVLPDGKIVIAGGFVRYNNSTIGRIARLNPDGTIDNTFNSGGVGFNGFVLKLLLQSDGKMVAVGGFTQYNGIVRNRIVRINSDGTLDATFNPGTGIADPDFVEDAVLQTDGKVVIAGSIASYNNSPAKSVVRINTNGSLDTSFVPGDVTDVYSLALQPDGKIILGGFFSTIGGVSRINLGRLNANGSVDTGFSSGSTFSGEGIYSILVQSDGKIMVGGTYSQTTYKGIARLNSNGSVDNTFSVANGPLRNDGGGYIRVIHQQSDGKYLVGGSFNSFSGVVANNVAKVNNNGTPDSGFTPGDGATGLVRDIRTLSGGKTLIVGAFFSFNNRAFKRIALLNTNGSLDSSFNPLSGTGVNSDVNVVRNLPSGKKIIAGAFTVFNTTPVGRIVQLKEDGSLDATFNTSNGGANASIYDVAVQNDGKLIIAGDFTRVAGQAKSSLARLNSDGTLDASFNAGLGANSYIYSVAIQSDGKVLAAGYIGSNSNPYNLVRFNADGSVDNTFSVNNTFATNALIRDIEIQPDGLILIAGGFTSVNGTGRSRIARMTNVGQLDASFNPGTGADDDVARVVVQPDGKILVGGYFQTFSQKQSRIVRLNSNGSLDNNFGGVANSDVESIGLYPDGKIVLVGWFTSINGSPRNRITVLNADGSSNSTFNPGSGVNSGVSDVAIEPNGDLVIVGSFTEIGTLKKNSVGRVMGIPIIVAEPAASPTNLQFSSVGPTSFNYSFAPSTPPADGYLHLRKEGSAPTDLPVDGVAYSQGQTLGSSVVVFSGTPTTNSQTAMATGTTYHYAIYAYNGSGKVINYRTQNPAIGNVTPANLASEPTAQPTALVFSEVQSTSFKISFSAAAPAPIGYLGVVSQGAPSAAPQDGTIYTVGQNIGNSVVRLIGSGTTSTITDLQKSTNYTVTVYSYNGTGTTVNYRQASPLANSVTTLAIDCAKPTKPTITPSSLNTESPVLTSSAATGNQWYRNNELIAGATNRTYSVTAIGSYTVRSTVDGGCTSDPSDAYVIVVTGDPALNAQSPVSWFPNPAKDRVIFQTHIAGTKTVRIVDTAGRSMGSMVSSSSSFEMDVSFYPSGLYQFIFHSTEGAVVGRIFKE